MGRCLYQRIYECSLCGRKPEDGEKLWEMGSEIWCDYCAERVNEGHTKAQDNDDKDD